jgi:hypothetical protein
VSLHPSAGGWDSAGPCRQHACRAGGVGGDRTRGRQASASHVGERFDVGLYVLMMMMMMMMTMMTMMMMSMMMMLMMVMMMLMMMMLMMMLLPLSLLY